VSSSKAPDSWSFLDVSGRAAEDVGGLRLPRPTAEEMEAMRKTDPGSLPWDVYCDFLKQFTPTREQLEALPLSPDVPPFRLD
jgi:hypothetical protein